MRFGLMVRYISVSMMLIIGLVLVVCSLVIEVPAQAQEADAVLVKDIRAGSSGSFPEDLVAAGNLLFFTTDTGLWRSDGTGSGTFEPGDPNVLNGSFSSLTNFNGQLFFIHNSGAENYELWQSDGTEAGTALVTDIATSPPGLFPGNLTVMGDTLFFGVSDLSGNNGALWKSDGTASGTTQVATLSGDPADTVAVGNRIFLRVRNTTASPQVEELWTSDGTSAGTIKLADFDIISNLTAFNGQLFFEGDFELWRSDGTVSGTNLVQAGVSFWGSEVIGNVFFFAHDNDLWKSDGTTLGTVQVKDFADQIPIGNGLALERLTNVNGTLFFVFQRSNETPIEYELWRSDGTEAGTTLVKTFQAVDGFFAAPTVLTNVNGVLFFGAGEAATGRELWRSDGTTGGTVLAADIDPGADSSVPLKLTVVGDTLFFSAGNDEFGNELWKYGSREEHRVFIPIIRR